MSKKELDKKIDIEVLPTDLQSSKNTEALQPSSQVDDIVDIASLEKSQIDIINDLLPATINSNELVVIPGEMKDNLQRYMKEVSRYKLLTPEEEKKLTRQLAETGDIEVAKKLVAANLRLVVKIAMEYRSAYKNVMDLIQEGNIGLMKAVSKYNPDKGAKLSYYSSWWIKSYILKFILDNFRLIKIGTTAEQKKLFYNLMREKERLKNQGIEPEVKLISENLGVSEKAVREMDLRLGSQGQEVSIDTPVSQSDNAGTIGDFIEGSEESIEDSLGHLQSLALLEENLGDFLKDLKPRDKEIFQKRLLNEVPLSLQSIADDYGVSRERIRQIEARLLEKLKVYMSDIIR